MAYRQYINISLNGIDLSHKNKDAPETLKYCNFLCQQYIPLTEFCLKKSNKIECICKKCLNMLNLAKKQIADNTITLEQFKENPRIVYGIEYISISTKECSICKQSKCVEDFEYGRTKCKECRSIEATKRNSNIDSYITDIESRKNNIGELKKYVQLIPKDKLVGVISHFSVGRKSTDTKEIMVKNVVEHFEKLLNPFLCRGQCGNILTEQFSTCDGCKRVKEKTKRPLIEFEEKVLPELIEKLESIKYEDDYLYNRLEVSKWAKALGLEEKQKMSKKDVIDMINNEVKKRIEDWARLSSTHELIKELEGDIGSKNTIINNTWIHQDLVFLLAQWISPSFSIRVSRKIMELLKNKKIDL
jgi:hypothetical protein